MPDESQQARKHTRAPPTGEWEEKDRKVWQLWCMLARPKSYSQRLCRMPPLTLIANLRPTRFLYLFVHKRAHWLWNRLGRLSVAPVTWVCLSAIWFLIPFFFISAFFQQPDSHTHTKGRINPTGRSIGSGRLPVATLFFCFVSRLLLFDIITHKPHQRATHMREMAKNRSSNHCC